jgi:hypothetical protein
VQAIKIGIRGLNDRSKNALLPLTATECPDAF